MSGGAYQDWSLGELCRRHGIGYEAGLRWIGEGHIKGAKKNEWGVWRVPLVEGLVFSALAAGKSPEEARAEADTVYKRVSTR